MCFRADIRRPSMEAAESRGGHWALQRISCVGLPTEGHRRGFTRRRKRQRESRASKDDMAGWTADRSSVLVMLPPPRPCPGRQKDVGLPDGELRPAVADRAAGRRQGHPGKRQAERSRAGPESSIRQSRRGSCGSGAALAARDVIWRPKVQPPEYLGDDAAATRYLLVGGVSTRRRSATSRARRADEAARCPPR